MRMLLSAVVIVCKLAVMAAAHGQEGFLPVDFGAARFTPPSADMLPQQTLLDVLRVADQTPSAPEIRGVVWKAPFPCAPCDRMAAEHQPRGFEIRVGYPPSVPAGHGYPITTFEVAGKNYWISGYEPAEKLDRRIAAALENSGAVSAIPVGTINGLSQAKSFVELSHKVLGDNGSVTFTINRPNGASGLEAGALRLDLPQSGTVTWSIKGSAVTLAHDPPLRIKGRLLHQGVNAVTVDTDLRTVVVDLDRVWSAFDPKVNLR